METTEYRLGNVCKLRNGYAFKSENFTNEGVPVIRISNIKDNEATVAKALKTNSSPVFDKFAVKKGDILIAMSGATTGKFGIYNSEEKAYQNQRVGCFVITNEEKLSNDYLYLLLNGLKRKIESDAYGGGQPNISSTIIENYKIHLPSLANQERIASVLGKSETLIKQRKASIGLLDEFLKNIFFKMFGDPIRNEKNWQIGDFEKLVAEDCPLTYGIVQPGEDFPNGVPIVRPVDLTETYISRKGLKLIDPNISAQFKRTILKGFEILMCVRGTTGTVSIASKELEGCNVTRGITPIWFSEDYNSLFAFFLLKSVGFQREIQKYTYGATLKQINLGDLRKIKFITPPLETQVQFATIAQLITNLKENYIESLNELEDLYASLSQRAFRGDLNIVERIEVSGSIKIQPKISAEVIAIDNINKQLADFHNSIEDSGAPKEIDNKLKHLDAELKLKGEIPFWDEYVKYRLIKVKQTSPFTFEKLWEEITAFPFESVPEYDTVKRMIFNLLKSDTPFLKQSFNESTKQIELHLNETTSA